MADIGDMIASGFGIKRAPLTSKSPLAASTAQSIIVSNSTLHDSSESKSEPHSQPLRISNYGHNVTSIRGTDYPAAVDRVDKGRPETNTSFITRSDSTTLRTTGSFNHNTSTNQTRNLTDCWAQWTAFWSISANSIDVEEFGGWEVTYTSTSLETIRRQEWLGSIILSTTTQTLVDNGYPFTTITSTSSIPTTFGSGSSYPWITGTNSIYTLSDVSVYWSDGGVRVSITEHPTTPNCILPPVMPQCQAQWNTWVSAQLATIGSPPVNCLTTWNDNNAFTATYPDISSCAADQSWRNASASLAAAKASPSPGCTLAHIDPTQCSGLQSSYLNNWLSTYTITGFNGSISSSNYWPSTSRLAPGCSLGCGPCAITGNTVQLFYWPVSGTQEAMNHTKRDYQPITAYTLNTTFISPTAYVYYSKIYAINSCGSPVGQTYYSRFVTITNTDELSSVWATVDATALLNDQGDNGADVPSWTAPFNFTDLNTPIPNSIYERQPWCVSWSTSKMRFTNPEGEANFNIDTASLVCPRTQSYDPILVVPLHSLQAIDPLWSTCSFDLRDVFDPPYDLQQVAAAATPTASDMMPAMPATPASVPQTDQPIQTSKSGPALPTLPSKFDPGNPPKGSGVDRNDPKFSVPLPHDPNDPNGPKGSRFPIKPTIDPDPRTSKTGSLRSSPGQSEAGVITKSILVDSIAAILDPHFSRGSPGSSIITSTDSNIENIGGDGGATVSQDSPAHEGAAFDSQIPEPHTSPVLVGATILPFSLDPALDDPKLGDPTSREVDSSDPEPSNSKSADVDPAFDSVKMLGTPFSGAIITASAMTFTVFQVGASGKVAVTNGLKWETLPVNGPAATMGKHTISAASKGVFFDGSIQGFSNIYHPSTGVSHQSEVIITMGSTSVVLQSEGTETLDDGQGLSVASNSLILVSATLPLSNHLSAGSRSKLLVPFIISGTAYTAFGNSVGHDEGLTIPMDGTNMILYPGGAATTLHGQALSAGAEGLVVGTYTVPYSDAPLDFQLIASFTISRTIYNAFQTADENLIPLGSSYMTLHPGGSPATLDGKILSAASNGIVIGGITNPWITKTIPDIGAFAPSTTTPAAELVASFTISGTPYTATETSVPGRGELILVAVKSGRVTLWPGGPAVTVAGEALSVATGGLVVGGVTKTMTTMTETWRGSSVATGTSVSGIEVGGAKSSGSLGSSRPDSGSGKLELPWNNSPICGLWDWLLTRIAR